MTNMKQATNKTVKQSLFSFIKFFIGWPLSLTAIYFIGSKTLSQLQSHPIDISKLSYSALLFSAVFFLLYFFVRAYIWWKEMAYFGYSLNLYESMYHWAASELKRYIPGNIWSFVGRGVRFNEKGVEKKHIFTSLVLEAQLIVFGAMVISLPSIVVLISRFVPSLSSGVILTITILSVFSILSAFFYQNILYKIKQLKFIHMIVSPLSAQKHMSLLLLSSVSYLFAGLGYYFSIISFVHIPPQLFLTTVSGMILAYLIGYLSLITPSGLGVRELVASLILSTIASATLVSFAVLFSRIFITLIELLFVSIIYFVHKKVRT